MIEVDQGIVFVNLAQGIGKMSVSGCAVDSLLRGFVVEVGFLIGAGVGGRRRPGDSAAHKAYERQGHTAGIDVVVGRFGRYDDREAGVDAARTPATTASPVPFSTRNNWSSLWTSVPISSVGLSAMTTSPSISLDKPFI